MVLLRQQLSRCHKGDLIARSDRVQRCSCRDQGFAGTDVALDQPQHWLCHGHVGCELVRDTDLRCGGVKR